MIGLNKICRLIRNYIKQGHLGTINDDSGTYPTVQVIHNGKTSTAVRLSPYGLDSNPPTKSLCLLINNQGQEAVKYAINSDVINRYKNLKEGEVALYNTLTSVYILFNEDGDIVVNNDNSSMTMLQNGEITVTNSGGATIILRTSGNIELNGNTDSAIAFTDMKLAFDTLELN